MMNKTIKSTLLRIVNYCYEIRSGVKIFTNIFRCRNLMKLLQN